MSTVTMFIFLSSSVWHACTTLFNHSPVEGHLHSYHLGAVTSKAAVQAQVLV